jgi:hypothetical protein
MRTMKFTTSVVVAAMLAATTGCKDFLSTGGDPNRSSVAGSKQLFVAIQANIWALYGSDLSRIAAMFTQQAEGIGAQYIPIYQYGISEQTTNGQHTAMYSAGGLVDVRNLKRQSEAVEDFLFLGIAQVQEALIMSLAADIFGDVVYSQALQGGNPPLDNQMDVYNALLIQLDSAIANINSAVPTNAGPEEADLVYWTGSSPTQRAAQREKWTRLAHSLKARIYMHMAEVDPSNYALALIEAPQGILDPADDYQANYTGNAGEANLLYQFTIEQRPGYIAPNMFIINLMDSLGDPRFDDYFVEIVDTAEDGTITSFFDYADGFIAPNTPQKIMTAAETRLIWAEAAFRAGPPGEAATQFNAYRTAYGLPAMTPGTGNTLLRNILQQKYIALFHQIEPYNDWKRTCYPNIAPVGSGTIPGRLFYDSNERNTNPNVPPPSGQPARNANDPANATDPFGNPCLGTGGGGA